MYLYNPSLFIAPIQPPQVDPDPVESSDDRIEVAEVEAAFEGFEEVLANQICRQISPFGKSVSNVTEAFPATTSPPRPNAPRGSFPSPFFNLGDSINVDNELHPILLSNTHTPVSVRSSGSRLPRRIVGPRNLNTGHSTSSQLIGRTWRTLFNTSDAPNGEADRPSQSFDGLRSPSVESIPGGPHERESNDNFLADEEEAEAAGVAEDDSNEMDAGRSS